MQVVLSNCGSKQMTRWFKNALNLRDGFRSIRYMVEHVVCDHRVEGLIFKGNGLRVDFLELERPSGDDQVPPGGIDHPRGKVAEGDVPSGRDAAHVFFPQITRTGSELQDFCILLQFEQRIKNPSEPTVGIRAETLMD